MRRPNFIARQARAPSGVIGRLVAAIMVRETEGVNRRAVDALDVAPMDSVLDIGCGNGLSLTLLATRSKHGRVAGIDPSPLMVRRATARNLALVAVQRVDISVAQVEHLPFPDESLDKCMSVHTLYFWENLSIAFHEISRVLKSGGKLALIFRTDADEDAVKNFPKEIYRFRPLKVVADDLEAAGFCIESSETDACGPTLLVAKKL